MAQPALLCGVGRIVVASMPVRIVSRRVILVSILMLIAAAGSVAQTANHDPMITDLQRQIQEMRLQMAGVPPIPTPVPIIVSTGLERTIAEAAARWCTSRVPTYVAHI